MCEILNELFRQLNILMESKKSKLKGKGKSKITVGKVDIAHKEQADKIVSV